MPGIRTMKISDYDAAIDLWQRDAGIGLSEADSRSNIARFLTRNPDLSYVYEADSQVVGTALCGHDGRRGYLYHVYVHPDWRRQGVGEALTSSCLHSLATAGIHKCHLYAYAENQYAARFWAHLGWQRRGDLVMYSHDVKTIDWR